jgi:alpha-tubulin suppressor-like RCC1 family protein
MRILRGVALAASVPFACGCSWSSAAPLADDAGVIESVSEDAGNDATPPPEDDANIAFIVADAAGLHVGSASVLAAGGQETCAVTTAGAVWCWGSNVNGQLGTSTGGLVELPGSTESITGAFIPVQVTGAGSHAVSVAVGAFHACALSLTGGASLVQCWGDDTYGQLGAGSATTTPNPTPASVTGLGSSVQAIAAGGYHTCALGGGAGMCWGDNADGQLGNGATTSSPVPVAVTGLSGVTAIAAGGAHTCAVTSTGGVECWGDNVYGQLGDGTTTSSPTPVTVSGLASGVTAIATGNSHTCALTSSGAVMCWGWNEYGQLGNNTTNSSSVPVSVTGLAPSIAVATGGTHTCALAKGGAISCWGDDQTGQLGDNDCIDSNVPVAVQQMGEDGGLDPAPNAVALAAGTGHTCALLDGGAALCWGWNVSGQVGNDTGADSETAVPVCGF